MLPLEVRRQSVAFMQDLSDKIAEQRGSFNKLKRKFDAIHVDPLQATASQLEVEAVQLQKRLCAVRAEMKSKETEWKTQFQPQHAASKDIACCDLLRKLLEAREGFVMIFPNAPESYDTFEELLQDENDKLLPGVESDYEACLDCKIATTECVGDFRDYTGGFEPSRVEIESKFGSESCDPDEHALRKFLGKKTFALEAIDVASAIEDQDDFDVEDIDCDSRIAYGQCKVYFTLYHITYSDELVHALDKKMKAMEVSNIFDVDVTPPCGPSK
jgi:uncharacterized coiled-coil protein SlyX